MKTVEVFMSTYNGEKYLKEQIDSILNQRGVNIKLSVRDDGSKDKTIDILRQYQEKGGLKFIEGENVYLTKSFFEVLNRSDYTADYYAFADQDDYWKEDKLITAIDELEKYEHIPALYYSALDVVDENLNHMYKIVKEAHQFSTSLIINEVAGCTMVFNKKLLELNAGYNGENARMHDHWLYLLCRAFDGYVFRDENSYILYRQHGNNTVGGIKSYKRRICSLADSMSKKPNERLNQLIDFNELYGVKLTADKKELLIKLINYKNYKISNRIQLIRENKYNLSSQKRFLFNLSILLGKF